MTRSGYTGEDGFELSLAAEDAVAVAEALLAQPEVAPVGLGARDTLRLEAGLCLYGHDIDETTTPVEAGLAWAIGRRRREAGDFPGAAAILRQLQEGPSRKRVGIRPDGRAPAREGTAITDAAGNPIGRVTSGGFGPSVGAPVAMGYVETAHAAEGEALDACRARRAAAGAGRAVAVRADPLLPRHPRRPRAACIRADRNTHRRKRMSETRYTRDHEWVRQEGDIAVIGITDYAQSQLGDVVYVELPEIGRTVEQGKEAAVVEFGEGGERGLCPGLRRGRRGQRRIARQPGAGQRRRDGRGLVHQAASRRPETTRRADGRGVLPGFRRGAGMMRYLPLTDADRREMLSAIGVAVDRGAVRRRAGSGAA